MDRRFGVVAITVVAALLTCNPAQAGLFGLGLNAGAPSVRSSNPIGKLASLKSSATTDVSDLWWNPSESGWGMQLVQNNNFVFATLFIYGANGAPTWLTAEMNNVGGFTWSGPLYATTGPSFAAPSFDPNLVNAQQVGSMTFTLVNIADGTVTYTVNGTTITKNVTRETLVNESLSGVYDAVDSYTKTCNPPYSSGTTVGLGTISLSQSGNSIVGQVGNPTNGSFCSLLGTYFQNGKLGAVNGSYSCSTGEVGTFQFFEVVVTEGAITGRLSEQSNYCPSISGRFAANKR